MNKYKDNFFKLSLQNLVLLGLVIAIKLCLSSVAIRPAFFKIGLAFLGSVALGYLFGPVWGGLGGLVSSLLHLIIFGDQANVLLGTMLSAILVPMIYGFFFYNKFVLKGLVPIRQRMISYEKSKNRIQEMEGETN